MPQIIYATADNAEGQLNAGISAAATSIQLKAGEGAEFPQPYTGSASSLGSATVLNDTGDLGNVNVGDFIRNITDGSHARVVTAGTNSITTTRLKGGTDDTWEASDEWQVGEFVVTLEKRDGDGDVTAREKVLIQDRSTDQLTARTRGYDGSTAQAFDTDDYVNLHVVSRVIEDLDDVIHDVVEQVDTNETDIATNLTSINTIKTGSYFYVVTTGSASAYVAATPALSAYAAGNIIMFNANHTNTGATTINVNGLGAKTIKKQDGATDLAANDIISGQLVLIQYDGTNFQMLSPTAATFQYYDQTVYMSGADSSANANPTTLTAFDTHTYSVPANDIVSGVGYSVECGGTYGWGAGNFSIGIMLGSTLITSSNMTITPNANGNWFFKGLIAGTAAAGASVEVRGTGALGGDRASAADEFGGYGAANVATNGGLTLQIGVHMPTSNGSNTATMTMARFAKHSSSLF